MALTKEQEALFQDYVKEWMKYTLCTEPADFPAAVEAINRQYDICGHKRPKRFAFFSSPRSAAVAAAIFKEHYKKKTKSWKAWIANGTEIITQDEIEPFLEANATEDFKRCATACMSDMGYGCHDAPWCVMYAFLLEEMKVENCKKLVPLMDLCKLSGWWAAYDEVCIVQDRPSTIKVDDDLKLHATDGPAIAYRDGYQLYCIHGVRIPDWIIEEPTKITPQTIEKEANAEVRRVMVEKFGQERYIKEGGFTKFHEDDFGILWNRVQPGDEDYRAVEVINATPESDGSFRHFFLRVPPRMRTAREAVAWGYRLTAEEYNPLVRT